MKLVKSLRFRIIAGYLFFTAVTTLFYSLGVLTVLRIGDDELFNWHIAKVAEREWSLLHEQSPERRQLLIKNNPQFVIGDNQDMLEKLYLVGDQNQPLVGSLMDNVRHVSQRRGGWLEIIELEVGESSYHIVKIPMDLNQPKQVPFFYYIVDITGYSKLDVWAFQGAFAGLLLLVILSLTISMIVGRLIANKVMSPLTQLMEDVDNTSVGKNMSSYFPDEVGVLAKKIDDMTSRIFGFIEREKAFSRDVSHELRTPITSSQVALELAMRLTESGDDNVRKALLRIQEANRDMTHLIETFMLIGRENLKIEVDSKTNLESVVSSSIKKNRYLISDKEISITNHVATNVVLPQPRQLLEVVIDNVLRNSFQYTDHGNVTIRGDHRYISVADTGIGFDQAALDRLMQPYETFHGQGVGLGLNIIKRICNLTGWKLQIKSQPGIGSLLTVNF